MADKKTAPKREGGTLSGSTIYSFAEHPKDGSEGIRVKNVHTDEEFTFTLFEALRFAEEANQRISAVTTYEIDA